MRDFLRGLLERLGYTVLTASDGREAVELAAGGGRQFQMLLSDVVMPRMNGVELARRLTAERPGLRVLLISGYTEKPEALIEERLGGATVAFLQKPFSSVTLAHRLREIFDGEAADSSVALTAGERRWWRSV